MKHLKSMALVGTCGALALGSVVSAQSQETGFYLKGDVGGNITQDSDLKEFFGPVAPGSKVKFDPGVRVGFAGGYHFTDWFAAEAEVGVMANTIDAIQSSSGVFRLHDASFANVPFLLNAKFQYPCPCGFTPYAGAGAGVSGSLLDADQITFISNGSSPSVQLHGSASDAVFAYQAFAGVRYALNDRMGLSVEYRYFAAESPEWESDFVAGAPAFSNRLSFGRTQTHAISLAFDYHF
ncbi:MAG TPA: porin family protein [Bacillota bacterium]|nr:porin family protein [Bacillota bacterium]